MRGVYVLYLVLPAPVAQEHEKFAELARTGSSSSYQTALGRGARPCDESIDSGGTGARHPLVNGRRLLQYASAAVQPAESTPDRRSRAKRVRTVYRRTLSRPSPRLITGKLMDATTIRALLRTYCKHELHLDHIHLSACWVSLGRLAKEGPDERGWLEMNTEALEPLVERTLQAAMEGEINARLLANVAHGAARSGSSGVLGALFTALSRTAHLQLDDFSAQAISNTAWAFATAGRSDPELFAVCAKAAQRSAHEFNEQAISNMAWAFALAGRFDQHLFDMLAEAAVHSMGDFNAQGIANLAWAFATVGMPDAQLFSALAKAAEQSIDTFNEQNVANTAWAFATAGRSDPALFTVLARKTQSRVNAFTTQAIANTAWAFATAGRSDEDLFGTVAYVVKRRRNEFSAQAIANIAWAYATAGRSDTQLFTTLSERARQLIGEFTSQAISNTAWAFATVGRSDPNLFAALAGAAERRIGSFTAQEIANTAWAFAAAGHAHTKFFSALAKAVEHRVGAFVNDELRQIHQWVLLHRELGLPLPLSPALRRRCLAAFRGVRASTSRMQREVASALIKLGVRVEEEVTIDEGYAIDIVVEWEGELVAVEVDGPYHYLRGEGTDRSANGATMLKRRLLRALGWRMVVVPYWEWKGSELERREYLVHALKSHETSSELATPPPPRPRLTKWRANWKPARSLGKNATEFFRFRECSLVSCEALSQDPRVAFNFIVALLIGCSAAGAAFLTSVAAYRRSTFAAGKEPLVDA